MKAVFIPEGKSVRARSSQSIPAEHHSFTHHFPKMTTKDVFPRLAAELQRLVDLEASVEGGACVLRVEVPSLGVVSRHAAGGVIRAKDLPRSAPASAPSSGIGIGERATVNSSFRTASVTKTFTAAIIGQMVTEGRLAFDDPMHRYLPPAYDDLVDKLHVFQGKSYGREITIRQCLAHSSGLFDYAMSPLYGKAIRKNPGGAWTPRMMLEGTIEWGKPHFAPDPSKYAYADTGYVLLGLIIENVDGMALHESYRKRILDPLGLNNTYLEGFEVHRGATMTHPYQGDFDVTQMHGSTDWAGGGLVSTTDDLAVFIQAFMRGDIVKKPVLDEMLHWQFRKLDASHSSPGFLGYGLGVYARESGGFVLRGHRGYWGVLMLLNPETGLTITGTINQTSRPTDRLVDGITAAVKDALGGTGGSKI